VPHPLALAGVPSEAKRAALAEGLAAQGADAAVISALDRWPGCSTSGQDVARTPVALSFLIAHADGTADLFIAPEKVTPTLSAHLGNAVRIAPRDAFVPALAALAASAWWWTRNARWTRSSPRWRRQARKSLSSATPPCCPRR
jgi:Xaa-Pro aminopeptidase